MFALNIFVLLVCATGILDAKKLKCDLNDMKCTTAAQQKLAYYETRGKKGLWDSSDPLKRSVIETSAPFLSIKAINSELTGMLQCQAEFLKMNTEAQTMDYSYICPRLTEAGDYQVNGYIGDEYVNGTGACRVTRDQHRMIINTKYEKYFQNETQYIQITGHDIIIPGSGKVSYDCETKLFNDDKQKADRVLGYMNKNWRTMERTIGYQMLMSYLKKYIKNINDELRVIAITDFFFYEV